MVIEHQDWFYANGPQPLQAWLNEVALVLDTNDRGNLHFCCPRITHTVAARLPRETSWAIHALLTIDLRLHKQLLTRERFAAVAASDYSARNACIDGPRLDERLHQR